ncbi:hypothetical protein [Massilia rubra]|nr:hypothetical protein [Massilia rubra]
MKINRLVVPCARQHGIECANDAMSDERTRKTRYHPDSRNSVAPVQ